MLECVVDAREQSLVEGLAHRLSIPVRTQMLPVGDVLVQTDQGEVLLLIERKTVRDLVQSLRDGRYHDQRRRWEELRSHSPHTTLALWLEGDLLSAGVDETLRSSLLNALFRLQTKHRILVHTVRSRDAFVQSLQLAVQKLGKDPYHLLPQTGENSSPPPPDLGRYKKSAHTQEHYWQNCLALIPGVSPQTAQKITEHFPSLVLFLRGLAEDPQGTLRRLADLPVYETRKLGGKQALRILQHMDPLCLDQKTKEEKINIS
jgi:ERCC4-type nuclease